MSANQNIRGFSLVEVVLALGIMTFALLALLVLLPLGVRNNQISAEETRAVAMLSSLEADLRNSRQSPDHSPLFQLELPYVLISSTVSGSQFNPSLEAGRLYTVSLDDSETPQPATVSARYQASVIYLEIPPPGSRAPLQARLIVNWPAIVSAAGDDAQKISALTNPSRVTGHVERIITFPAP